jgi:hypothetical protein
MSAFIVSVIIEQPFRSLMVTLLCPGKKQKKLGKKLVAILGGEIYTD